MASPCKDRLREVEWLRKLDPNYQHVNHVTSCTDRLALIQAQGRCTASGLNWKSIKDSC